MTHINDTLWNLWKTAEFHYTSPEEKRAQVDAYDSLAWYCDTGRSTVAFERALAKANPKKLLGAMLRGDASVDGHIASAKKYLSRYCGL